MYTCVTFAPPDHSESLLKAVFSSGAGRIGAYERCAFLVRGEGRFRPLAGSDPFLGVQGKDERVAEDRIEFVVPDDRVEPVLAALRSAHPYEEPAVYLYRLDLRCVGGAGTKAGA